MRSILSTDDTIKRFRLNVGLLNLSLFFRSQLFLLPVMLLFYQENGLSASNYFFFQGIFYLVSILIEFPVGYLSDFFSRKKLLILSYILFMARVSLWYFFKGYWVILAGEIIFAVSKIMFDANTSGYLYDYLKEEKKESVMVRYFGRLNFFLAIGTAIATLIGTFLYIKLGSKMILLIEFFIIALAAVLLALLPNIPSSAEKMTFSIRDNFNNFIGIAKNVLENRQLKYYVFYSGLLVAMSILFSTSFQPLMQNSLFPVFLFGVVLFINHITRALFSLFTHKILKFVDLKKMGILTLAFYVIGFLCVFAVIHSKNILLDIALLVLVCVIIGFQLMFTIAHISRLHSLVTSDVRSAVTSFNSVISRSLTAFVLVLTGIFMNRFDLTVCFSIYFMVFVFTASFFVFKIVREEK